MKPTRKQVSLVQTANALDSVVKNVSGLKYKGPRRTGFASLMDPNMSGAYVNELNRFNNGSSLGSVRLAAVNADGSIIKNKTINIGGKLYTADGRGTFNIVDKEYLNEVKQIAIEKEQYINDVLRLCITGDEVCATVLGLSMRAYQDAMEGVEYCQTAPDAIKKANATVSILNVLPQQTPDFQLGLAKLKVIISTIAPIIDGLGDPDEKKLDNAALQDISNEDRKKITDELAK